MPRYRLLLEYDGGCFCGWQSQAMPLPQERAAQTRISVQDTLIRAVEDFCGESVAVTGAGRTDSGVHALGQVAHFDLERQVDGLRLREALNFHLREAGVVVLEAGEAAADFHARFDATARRYIYRICNRRASPIIDRGRV
ncbi:MAG: tRNA pseudouridine synthase A, partial [Hyphomicrobiales bacterium]|nr:tRNA pseudouridine synthase A [Hyphomicrobiales bacterium]